MLPESPLWQLAAMAVWILIILGAAYWVTRYVGRKGPGNVGKQKENLRIVGALALGREQKLLVVQVGEKHLILGVTAGEIRLLGELTEQEAAGLQKDMEPAPPGFGEALQRVLAERKQNRKKP